VLELKAHVYGMRPTYASTLIVRTNIEIDDDLMAAAMRATGQSTKRGTVEETLRRAVASQRRLQAIEDRRRSTMSESVGSLAGRGRQGSTAREWPTGLDREGFDAA
jgi:Arc/MetJ family transcription regulator